MWKLCFYHHLFFGFVHICFYRGFIIQPLACLYLFSVFKRFSFGANSLLCLTYCSTNMWFFFLSLMLILAFIFQDLNKTRSVLPKQKCSHFFSFPSGFLSKSKVCRCMKNTWNNAGEILLVHILHSKRTQLFFKDTPGLQFRFQIFKHPPLRSFQHERKGCQHRKTASCVYSVAFHTSHGHQAKGIWSYIHLFMKLH